MIVNSSFSSNLDKRQVDLFESGFLAGVLFPTSYNDIDVFGVELCQPCLPTGFLSGDERAAGAAKQIQHDILAFGGVTDSPFNRLHSRMEIIFDGLVEEPDIPLVSGTTPEVIGTFFPAVENGFVLALVISATESEGILGPDQEGGPLASRIPKGSLEGVQLRRRHAYIERAFADREHVGHSSQKKRVEVSAQVIV